MGNDDVIVHVLSILMEIPEITVNRGELLKLEEKTQNKHMKLAIFNYINRVDGNVNELLHKYSDPNEL